MRIVELTSAGAHVEIELTPVAGADPTESPKLRRAVWQDENGVMHSYFYEEGR